jgi:hypothetical protein
MKLNTEQLELLITRSLDGEINAADRAILDAELKADPQARRLFNQCRRLDDAARTALREAVDAPRIIRMPAAAGRSTRRLHWFAAAAPLLAAAAAVVFFVTPRGAVPPSDMPRPTDSPQIVSNQKPPLRNLVPHVPVRPSPDDPAAFEAGDPGVRFVDYVDRPVVQPRRLNRHQTRDWIGVMDESGQNIYLLQNNHRRTRIVPVSGDF